MLRVFITPSETVGVVVVFCQPASRLTKHGRNVTGGLGMVYAGMDSAACSQFVEGLLPVIQSVEGVLV
jgi:hypothetical protein